MPTKATPTAVVADDERLMRDQLVTALNDAWPELRSSARPATAAGDRDGAKSRARHRVPRHSDARGRRHQAAQALAGATHVVFLAAHDQFAIDAFQQGAVDYLLKPAEPERVAFTCQRLRERLQHKPEPMET